MSFIRENYHKLSHSPTWFHLVSNACSVTMKLTKMSAACFPGIAHASSLDPQGQQQWLLTLPRHREGALYYPAGPPKMSRIHTLTTRKQTVAGGEYGGGQHSCDKALTVSLFSLQPAHAGTCWNKYQLTPLGHEPTMGRGHKYSKQVKSVAVVPVTCW